MDLARQANERLLGEARFARYVRDCVGDRNQAHELYLWNIHASGAVFEAVHIVEVVLRNALDLQLRDWNESMGSGRDWLLNPHEYLEKVLDPSTRHKAVARAKSIAREKSRPMLHDDVLAQMSFGTWRYLLPSRSNKIKRRLWVESTSSAFPLWPGPWPNLITRIETIHDVRNRVAHLEPLHDVDLRAVRRSMRDVCHAISWDAGRLFSDAERIIPALEAMPSMTLRVG